MDRNHAAPTLTYLNQGNATTASTSLENVVGDAAAQSTVQNRYVAASAITQYSNHQWYWLATVRLGELHSFFQELPLTKSPLLRLH